MITERAISSRRRWEVGEVEFLRNKYWSLGPEECAKRLRRDYFSVTNKARRVVDLSLPACNEFFFNTFSKESCYCAALISSDGCMHEKENRVTFDSTDRELVDILKGSVGFRGRVSVEETVNKDRFRIYLGSRRIYDSLRDRFYVSPRKSCGEFWPYSIPSSELMWHFIRGFMDGDGCVSFSGRNLRTIFYGGRALLKSLKRFFLKQGIRPTVVSQQTEKVFWLAVSNKKSLRTLFDKMYYNSEGLRLTRKYERFRGAYG